MPQIRVNVFQLHKDTIINLDPIVRPLDGMVTIGRGQGDVNFSARFVSRSHGRIFLEHGFFSQHLDYEDTSSIGTNIIHWEGGICKSEFIRGGPNGHRVKIKPGDWIIIAYSDPDGLKDGLILVPFIE